MPKTVIIIGWVLFEEDRHTIYNESCEKEIALIKKDKDKGKAGEEL